MLTRREFGKIALAGLPAATVVGSGSIFGAFAQTRPNSLIEGVQIGTITYSFRSMTDQSAEATLKYIVDAGISAIELMGGPVESFAGAPAGAGRGGGGGGGGRGRGRGDGAAAEPPPIPEGAKMGSWNGQSCVIPEGRGGGGGGQGGGRRGGGRGEANPEQVAAQQEQAAKMKAWRTSVSTDPFKKLRKMYNDAGVTIYAWKQLNTNMSDEELEYIFNVAEALGCTHTTVELPTDADRAGTARQPAAAALKRLGDLALKKKIYAAYHTHAQGNMTAFDQAFSISKGNMANVDFGHWVAAGNVGGTPMQFLEKHHDRISSFHLKDRTTPEHCALNLPWGTGETPIKQILQLVKKNKWKIPGSIELEYNVPEGSDAVQETRKCVEYCRAALTART
jgi:sugar phosphate isomerase/epimerase